MYTVHSYQTPPSTTQHARTHTRTRRILRIIHTPSRPASIPVANMFLYSEKISIFVSFYPFMKLETRWRDEEYICCVQHRGDICTGCLRRNLPFVSRTFPYFYFCQGSHNITTLIDYAEMKPRIIRNIWKNALRNPKNTSCYAFAKQYGYN